MTPNIIFINGPSSVGKSSLAKEIQNLSEAIYLHIGIDWFIQAMPQKLWNSPEGFLLKEYEECGRKLIQIESGKKAEKVINSIGPVIETLLNCGNNLIIDEVILSENDIQRYIKILKNYNVLFVGLTAPLEILIKRELERMNRTIGMAERQNKITHDFVEYDLFIDTHDTKPADSAKKIIRSLEGHKNRALKKMLKMVDKK